MNDFWIIGVVGGGAGAVLGAPLLVRREAASATWSIERLVGVWLLGGAAVIVLAALRHGGFFTPRVDLGVEILTDALGMIAWTVLVMLVNRMTGTFGRWPDRVRDHLLLPGLYLSLVAAAGFPDVPHLWLMPIGIACTAAVARAWLHARRQATADVRDAVSVVFAFAVVLCLAQLARSTWPQVLALREIVPLVVTVSYFAAAVPLAGWRFAPRAPTYAKSGLTDERARRLVARLDESMDAQGWYRDADLSLASLADRLGVSTQWVSQALNQQRSQSLPEYLADWRLRETKALLADPANDVYTVEGLAKRAGFASRSSFYRTYREREGGTPAALRRRPSVDALTRSASVNAAGPTPDRLRE